MRASVSPCFSTKPVPSLLSLKFYKKQKNDSYEIKNKYINKINNVEENMYSKRLLKYKQIYSL